MSFDPIMAETRFGCGLSPVISPPRTMGEMLSGVETGDGLVQQYPIDGFDTVLTRIAALKTARDEIRSAAKADMNAALKEARNSYNRMARDLRDRWLVQSMLRRANTRAGFAERLAFFWEDHFTAKGKSLPVRYSTSAYVESAIRPHLGAAFEDLLISAVTNPLMVTYLDQHVSVGPNSIAAKRRKNKNPGLNENLAREILELHTLGVDGPYTQDDVRQLAELLTGLGWDAPDGTLYRPKFAEPGSEKILGKWYGTQQGSLADIHNVLRDLARHPSTARHISRKLAVHFVSDAPDPDLVTAMERAYLETNGYLPTVYRALLNHPSAWTGEGTMKQPVAFVGSTLRALGLREEDTQNWKAAHIRRSFLVPLQIMGQPWQDASGPDGWPEEDSKWATPQGLAARLQWALRVPNILDHPPPDPRQFVTDALGPTPPERVAFAASAAESRREGVALILLSPAFQRH